MKNIRPKVDREKEAKRRRCSFYKSLVVSELIITGNAGFKKLTRLGLPSALTKCSHFVKNPSLVFENPSSDMILPKQTQLIPSTILSFLSLYFCWWLHSFVY